MPTSGGTVCNGSAIDRVICRNIATGGAVLSGSAEINPPTINITASGGMVCSGTATHSKTYQVVATGGAVIGYRWKRRQITIPSGNVSANLDNFAFVTNQLIDDLDTETLYVKNNSGQIIPHRLRSWDGDRLHLDIRLNLKTASDNIVWLYYEVST